MKVDCPCCIRGQVANVAVYDDLEGQPRDTLLRVTRRIITAIDAGLAPTTYEVSPRRGASRLVPCPVCKGTRVVDRETASDALLKGPS